MAVQAIALLLCLAFILPDPVFATPQNTTGVCAVIEPKRVYPTNWITFPVDHFHNESRYEPHSDRYFRNRFWYDDTYYKPGGPVIVQNTGESSGSDAFTELEIGLLHELAQATNGLAVLLEHRYFGHSVPVLLRNITTDYRFLSTEQAMADQAYFAQNVVFPSQEGLNLTAPNTPWFAIGCSYPGGLTAFERIQYPDLFWAALSSSGITAPTANNWEYLNVVREYSPHKCASTFGKIINIVDNILLGGNTTQITQLKVFFHSNHTSNGDFAASLYFWYELQGHYWIPCINKYDELNNFCQYLTAPTIAFPKTEKLKSSAQAIVANGGWANETDFLTTALLNYVGNPIASPVHSAASNVRAPGNIKYTSPRFVESWTYLRCSEWGTWQTGDQPAHPLPIISPFVTLDYLSQDCETNFNLQGIPIPHAAGLNKYGRHNLSYPRLMLIGGEEDPWRPLTPLASRKSPTRLDYASTPEQPWVIIPKATHCWDFSGVTKAQERPGVPPESIRRVHDMEKETFKRWLREWHDAHPDYNVYAQ